MRKNNRILLYIFACLGVLLLPNMISFVKMEWQWLGHNVAKENLWTSVSLACIALLVEFFYSHRHEYKRQSPKIYATSASPLYFDSPTSSDLFNRKSYAKLLLNKIYSSFSSKERNKHSFVIHIGEHYGQGKTSFLMMLEEEIKSSKIPVVNIHYEPWLCDSEAGIINEFFDTFRIEVGKYLPRLNGTMQQYVRLLLSSIKYESRWLTVSLASLFGSKSTLKTTHDLIRDELMKIDCPIIITIDDVDRLQGKELMMVLKIIRDTADFPNVFYILAADNIHLKRMLKSLNINNPDEYLKKFFNLEFQLPANENVAFGELLKILEGKYQDLGIDEKTSACYVWQIRNVAYIREAFPNMRDVYRFINSYFLSIDSMQEVRQLNLYDLFLLTLIQTLNMEYYLQLRDHSLNLLNVVHSGNDILLQWKGDLNVIQKRQEKEAMVQMERIRAKDINTPYKEKCSEEVVVPDFEETIKKTIITPNDILPGLMNLLFGQGTQNVSPNRACRHNMFFKYFANIDASYMVSRMEVIDMLNSNENVYRSRLIEMFETQRDAHFLSEFTYSIPYVKRYKETDVLKRFFIFIALSYKYKRDLTDHSMIKSLADYEGWEPSRHKLFNVLACMYRRNKQVNVKDKLYNFTLLCTTCSNINILLVCLNIMSNQLGYFIFDRKYVDETNILLVDRFFKEKVEKSMGNIGIQEIDTILQIKCDYDMREHWNKRFEQLIKEDKNTCLNLFCRLVIFYNNGNIEWDFHYKRAILGESSLPEDNLLSRLAEAFPDEKDIFHSLLTLHNHFRSLTDVSNLKDDAFIKMASSRQKRLCI